MTAANTFIPSGQTSLVKKGEVSLQVQTEYSFRPYPRIKTIIFNNGRVIHKIEKKLSRPIESIEEQNRMEGIIKEQHKEVVSVIKENSYLPGFGNNVNSQMPMEESVKDKLSAIPGVQRVFHLNKEGDFVGSNSAGQFKKSYSAIFKSLPQIMEVFKIMPGGERKREKGVYEIERNRLYFASVGDEYFLITVQSAGQDINYEKTIKDLICPLKDF